MQLKSRISINVKRVNHMAKSYKDMLDSAFMNYYERFRELNATSKENAVTGSELFPMGESYADRQRMKKMLSMGIVKRNGLNRYWLDEERAADGNAVLKQRILIIIAAVILGLGLALLNKLGIVNF